MTERELMLGEANWAVGKEPSIHYAETRPIPLEKFKAHKLPLTTDCSGFVTSIAYAAGVDEDPNGQDYNGQGYTGTLLSNCPHIHKADALAGDFVVFGPYPGEHVVMLMDPGSVTDPIVVSHGQEKGPFKLKLSAEASAHSSGVTFLRSVPLSESKTTVWDIRDGKGVMVAKGVKHPALWSTRHPKAFRRYRTLTYHQRRV